MLGRWLVEDFELLQTILVVFDISLHLVFWVVWTRSGSSIHGELEEADADNLWSRESASNSTLCCHDSCPD